MVITLPKQGYDSIAPYLAFIQKSIPSILNLMSTNKIFRCSKTLRQFIQQQNSVVQERLLNLLQDSLLVSPNTKINSMGLTKRLLFLYALEQESAPLIVTHTGGLDPLGKEALYETLGRDQEKNIVVELVLS